MKRSLIIVDARNRLFKKDGDEFMREAESCAEIWKQEGRVEFIVLEDKKFWAKHRQVVNKINALEDKIDRIGIFSHGTWRWNSIGFNIWNVEKLARILSQKVNCSVEIALYSCLNGRGKRKKDTEKYCKVQEIKKSYGFAMNLCRELHDLGIVNKILAHTTRGHTTRNPNCVFVQSYELDNWIDKIDRRIIIHRGSDLRKPWIKMLQTDIRFSLLDYSMDMFRGFI